MKEERAPRVTMAMEELFLIMSEEPGLKTARAVRALSNAIWVNSHADKPLWQDTHLLAGMAVAALSNYGDMLADREADELEEENK
jgi:hypothetical protein